MKKPNYSDDSYAARFLGGYTVFPDDTRIFHRAGYQYDEVALLGKPEFTADQLTIDLTHWSGAPGMLTIRPVHENVLRIQFGAEGAKFQETSPMLLPFPEKHPGAEYREEETKLNYCFFGYRVELDKSPFCLRVYTPKNELIFESETERLVGLFTAPPMGLRYPSDEAIQKGAPCLPGDSAAPYAFFSWRTRNQDRYFGLGEKFNKLEKTGTRATIWEADTCGSNTTDMSYKATPVVFSTAGWALLLHSSFRSYWELGSFSYATAGLMVEEAQLDLFLILAPTLKEQVTAYTALTGRPTMPPRWAFGAWMSRAAYMTREQMWEVAERLRAEEIPCDTFNIDQTWMQHAYYNEIGVEVCNFGWNARDWGEPEDLFAQFAGLGYGICLWINPYFSEESAVYAEARHKGYLVKTTSGGIARLEYNLAAGIIDLTHPEAKTWWQAKLIDLLEKGAFVFKVDFGDRIPENALFSNGKTGLEMHNLFVHLYAQAVFEATEQAKGAGIVWRRPGYIGSQRYPGCWAGDTQVTWEGMAGALRGGLSAAFTGDSFWSHDIGGFVGQTPPEELYIRWAQFGMLSPFTRFHGTTPREPWCFSQRAVEIVRDYARLRYTLVPYLLAYGYESTQTGLPLLRPMVLEFPNEPRIDTVDDQYLLGPDLLFAPVLQPGVNRRAVYLPKGQWWALDRPGNVVNGPGYHEVDAPIERAPLFARAGAILPRYKHAPYHLKGPTPKEWTLDIYPGNSHRRLVIPENGFTLTIDYQSENGVSRLIVSPAPVTISIRLIDRRPLFLRADGAVLQPGSAASTFSVDLTHGVKVDFKV